jgi:hypothetical protein
VLAINGAMFLVEIGAGLAAGSASLQADALDFLGDTANYAISLFVVGMALRYRAAAAMVKGLTMGAFGLWIVGTVIWHALHGTLPTQSQWALSASLLSWRTECRSPFFGRTVKETPTCALPGFARATTFLEIWRCYSRRLACSALAPDGLIR